MHGAGNGTEYGGNSVLSDAMPRYVKTTTTTTTTKIIITTTVLMKYKNTVIVRKKSQRYLLIRNHSCFNLNVTLAISVLREASSQAAGPPNFKNPGKTRMRNVESWLS